MRIIDARCLLDDDTQGVVIGWTHQAGAPDPAHQWLVRVIPDRDRRRRPRSEHHLPSTLRVEQAGGGWGPCPPGPDLAEVPALDEEPEA